MKSLGLARRVAALGATTAVLATMVAGLMTSSAHAATSVSAGKATQTAAATKPKVSVSTPKASERDYQGSCPTKVSFSAQVRVKLTGGKTTLAYRWLHGDGSASKVKTIKLSGKGTKTLTVKQALSFGGDVKGWEALQVLSPRKVTSKKGYFSVDCVENRLPEEPKHEDNAWARAWVNPDVYVGSCTPGDKIHFTGLIKVDSPRWVKYRWILNGRVVDGGAVKVHDTRKVGFGFSPRESHRGWAVLELVGKNTSDSNRVHYKVVCKDEPAATKVSVSNVGTSADAINCKVGASADINSTGPGRVTYVFTIDGKTFGGSVEFAAAGTKRVETDATALTDATKGGTATISITGPNNSDSGSQVYSAPCQTNTGVTIQADVTVAKNECPKAGGTATASVTVNGKLTAPLKVTVVFDGVISTLTFDKEGTQSLSPIQVADSGSTSIKATAGDVSGEDSEKWDFKPCEVPKPAA